MATTKDKDEGGPAASQTGTQRKSSTARPKAAARSVEAETRAAAAEARAAEAERVERAERKDVSCNVPFCPICTVLSTAQHLQPEIIGHLLTAAREISMAVRAVVDQRGDEVAPKQQHGLQHIDLA
jgi:hypothetical protein